MFERLSLRFSIQSTASKIQQSRAEQREKVADVETAQIRYPRLRI